MSAKVTKYQAQAVKYFDLAEEARDFGVKARLLEMADSWLRLDEEAACSEGNSAPDDIGTKKNPSLPKIFLPFIPFNSVA